MRRELVAPLILVVVAVIFAGFVQANRLTTWTGPGFSMFASADYLGTRSIQVSVTVGDETGPAEIPSDLADELDRQRHTPDQQRLDQAAEQLLALSWRRNDDGLFVAEDGTRADRVRLRLVTIAGEGDQIVVSPILETMVSS
jgi:hypothetical protein